MKVVGEASLVLGAATTYMAPSFVPILPSGLLVLHFSMTGKLGGGDSVWFTKCAKWI